MDYAFIIDMLNCMSQLSLKIKQAEEVAQREKECNGCFCRIPDSTIELWKQCYNSMEQIVKPYKADAIKWKNHVALEALKEFAKAVGMPDLALSNIELAS